VKCHADDLGILAQSGAKTAYKARKSIAALYILSSFQDLSHQKFGGHAHSTRVAWVESHYRALLHDSETQPELDKRETFC
jgi:hypothetical protein